jgi:hypothetical protein
LCAQANSLRDQSKAVLADVHEKPPARLSEYGNQTRSNV